MRLLLAALVTAIVGAGGAAPASAADLKATSVVDAVTVFPDGAEVSRVAHVTLAAGDQTVVLRDLPASLIGDSVRIQGEAAGKVEIGSVDTRQFYRSEDDPNTTDEARKKLQDQMQELQDKQKGFDAAISAAKMQVQLIDNVAKLPLRPPVSGTAAGVDPDWGQVFTLIGARLTEANKTIADNEIARRDNDKKLAELTRQLEQQPQSGDQRTEIKVHVTTAAPLDVTLHVRYQVPGAAWYPIYDARLDSGDGATAPKLALVRRAIVSQQTGETWDDVQLALSTTRPGAGTVAPELLPLSVDFAPAPVAYDESAAPRLAKAMKSAGEIDAAKQAVGGTIAQNQAVPAAAPAQPAPVSDVEQQHATTINSAFAAVYVIPDRQTIKSGVGDKRVQIDTKAFEPKLSVRAVPKFNETAFLYAKYTLDADSLLLPGDVSLFRDGVFVGRGSIAQLIGGEEQELGFGADDKVRIKFANLGRKAGETGLISTSKTDTQAFKVTVKNLHARAIDLRILDQVPVSVNDQIKVDMLPNSAPPTVRDVEDKKGLLAWDMKLDAAQQQELSFGYQVSWPAGHDVFYEQHPGPWQSPRQK